MGPGYWLDTFDGKAYRVDRHENWIMQNLDQLPEKYAKPAALLDQDTQSDEIRYFGVKSGLIRIRKYRNRWSMQFYRSPHKVKDALWSFYEWWIKESGGLYDEVTIHNMYNDDSIDITKKELGQRLKDDAVILREESEDLASIDWAFYLKRCN